MYLCPNLDSYLKTCFSSFTIKLVAVFPWGRGQSLAYCDPPLPGKAIKLFFPPLPLYSAFQFCTSRQKPNFSNKFWGLIWVLPVGSPKSLSAWSDALSFLSIPVSLWMSGGVGGHFWDQPWADLTGCLGSWNSGAEKCLEGKDHPFAA